jgi:hypothetical protein
MASSQRPGMAPLGAVSLERDSLPSTVTNTPQEQAYGHATMHETRPD